jgi:hypothetical protein
MRRHHATSCSNQLIRWEISMIFDSLSSSFCIITSQSSGGDHRSARLQLGSSMKMSSECGKNRLKMLHGLTRCKTTNGVLGWFLTPKSSEKRICNVRTTRVSGPSSLTPKGYGSQKAVASVALVRARIPENVFGVWGFDVI